MNDTIAAAFWRLVDVRGIRDCWAWKGALQNGYGSFSHRGRQILAHRFAWSFAYGRIARGKGVLHCCDVRSCVNPRHLRLGTTEDNNADKSVLARVARVVAADSARQQHQARQPRRSHLSRSRALALQTIPGGNPEGLRYSYRGNAVQPLSKQSATRLRRTGMTDAGVKYIRELYRWGADLKTIAGVCRIPSWQARSIITRATWRHLP